MSSGFADIFGSAFGSLFGVYPEPPDTVPLRILGLAERPASRDAVRQAFRARLKQVHPDVDAYGAVTELQRAADALAIQRPEVAELVWARDVLLQKIPERVTGEDAPRGTMSIRHEMPRYEPPKCKACAGERLNSSGKPYPLNHNYYGRRGRWDGYCWPCANDGERQRQRDLRRQARADRVCAECGGTFTPPRSDGRYCSPACRQRAYRQRQAAA